MSERSELEIKKMTKTENYLVGYKDAKADMLKVLQEIRQEIADYKDDKIIHEERNGMIDIILEMIDDKIKEYTE